MKNSPDLSFKRIVFKLRFYREAANVSQKEAAEKLNIGYRSYQRIESAEASCDISFLHRFCIVFFVDFVDLASPSPPRLENINLFIDKKEQQDFENLPFIQKINLKDWVSSFENKTIHLGEDEAFTSAEHPFCIWTSSKKIINNNFYKSLDVENKQLVGKISIFSRDEKINALDCLFYYRPKYSVKKISNQRINGIENDRELYSIHFYDKNEFNSLSILKITPLSKKS